ncbi:MAG: sigma-70 family RNA polymerase sigma factor [Bryobacteraceae bacterium]
MKRHQIERDALPPRGAHSPKPAAALSESHRDSFFALVAPYLDTFNDFVKHEIAHAEAAGDLARGALRAEELADEALLAAHEEHSPVPDETKIRAWLTGFAIKRLDAEIRRCKLERLRAVHVEDAVSETPPSEEVSTLGEEVLDFYQPDQSLRLEDMVPDFELHSPEEKTEAKEVRRLVARAMMAMPHEPRRFLFLRFLQGLSLAEVATATGKSETEVDQILDSARTRLRDNLKRLGLQRAGSHRASA